VEELARTQAWDRQRPWRVATHVRWGPSVPEVDLHDLKVTYAKRVVSEVLDHPGDSGAVVFVTGRGRHSLRHDAPLKLAVHGMLRKASTTHPQATLRVPGPGRVVWLYDRSRAPASVTGGSGWLWLWFAVIAIAAVAGLAGKGC